MKDVYKRQGLYVPGGEAPLFSTVLMLAVPARVAGCGEVILCTCLLYTSNIYIMLNNRSYHPNLPNIYANYYFCKFVHLYERSTDISTVFALHSAAWHFASRPFECRPEIRKPHAVRKQVAFRRLCCRSFAAGIGRSVRTKAVRNRDDGNRRSENPNRASG